MKGKPLIRERALLKETVANNSYLWSAIRQLAAFDTMKQVLEVRHHNAITTARYEYSELQMDLDRKSVV